jgi:hypothetical protein
VPCHGGVLWNQGSVLGDADHDPDRHSGSELDRVHRRLLQHRRCCGTCAGRMAEGRHRRLRPIGGAKPVTEAAETAMQSDDD